MCAWIKTYFTCASTYIVSVRPLPTAPRYDTRRTNKTDTLTPTDKYNQIRQSTVQQPAIFCAILKIVPASFTDLIRIDHNKSLDRHYRDLCTDLCQKIFTVALQTSWT